MTVAWSYGVYTCVPLFVEINIVGIWKLLKLIHQLEEGHIFFYKLLANFF